MSAGAGQRHEDEGDEAGLDHVSSTTWFLRGRSIPYRVDHSYDIPYVGGISRDGRTVYVDRKAYPALLAQGVLPGPDRARARRGNLAAPGNAISRRAQDRDRGREPGLCPARHGFRQSPGGLSETDPIGRGRDGHALPAGSRPASVFRPPEGRSTFGDDQAGAGITTGRP